MICLKGLRRVVACLLCCMLIASSFSGCKKDAPEVDETPEVETSVSTGEYAGKVKIKLTKAEKTAYERLYGGVPETEDFKFVSVADALEGQSMLMRYWWSGWDPSIPDRVDAAMSKIYTNPVTWAGVTTFGSRILYDTGTNKKYIQSGVERFEIEDDISVKDITDKYGFAMGVLGKRSGTGHRLHWFDGTLDYQRYTESLLNQDLDEYYLDVPESGVAVNNVLTDIKFHRVNGVDCMLVQDAQSVGGMLAYKLDDEGWTWGFRMNAPWLGVMKEDGYSNIVLVAKVGEQYPVALNSQQQSAISSDSVSIVVPGVMKTHNGSYLLPIGFLQHVLGWQIGKTVMDGFLLTTDDADTVSPVSPEFVAPEYYEEVWRWEHFMDSASDTWRSDEDYVSPLPESYVPLGRSASELETFYGDSWYRDEKYNVWVDQSRRLSSEEIETKVKNGDMEGLFELPIN